MQTFDTMDRLRLEVEADVVGLVNQLSNPNGEYGGWGWTTPVAGTAIYPTVAGLNTVMLQYRGKSGVANWFYTEPVPVTPGEYIAARWENPAVSVPGGVFHRARFQWLDADRNLLGSVTQSGYLSSGTGSRPATLVPATSQTVPVGYVRLLFDVYGNTSGANLASDATLDLYRTTLAKAPTSGALAGLGWLDPAPYTNVLGPTHSIKVTRDELSVGLLTAEIFDAALDPSASTALRPGRRVRVMARPAGNLWTPLFLGKIRNAQVNYDYKTPGLPDAKRAHITLSASDAVADVAAVPAADGVATIGELAAVIDAAGVPWSINGSGNPFIGIPSFVSHNPNASVLDQLAITRDSVHGYAWIDRYGVVNAWDADEMPTTPAAVFDESDYTDLVPDYDTDRCINIVNLKYLRTNLATSETVEVAYGPYVDEASVKQWGPHEATFTVHGFAETEPNMAAHAAVVLAANATPQVRVNSVTLHVGDVADIAYSVRDLYDLVTIQNAAGGIDQDLRITGVEHVITAGRSSSWFSTYRFAAEGGVAPPINTPSPGPTVIGTDWTALTLASGFGAIPGHPTPGVRHLPGDMVVSRGLVNAPGTSLAFNLPIATLPAGFRPNATHRVAVQVVSSGGGDPTGVVEILPSGVIRLANGPATAGNILALSLMFTFPAA